jgi:hypothetical protein
LIKNAIIYKSGVDEIAVVVLAGKEHMAVIYGNDYSIEGFRIGNVHIYHITVKLDDAVVGCLLAEEYINEIWKGVPEL